MTTRISSNNLDTSVTAQFGPKISGIAIANNSYTVLDDTAVSTSGGYIIISGSNFATGCSVLIGSVVATSVSFINSTTVRAQVPAQAAGSYTVYLTNPDGGVALRINGLNYSATPTWSTTSPLPASQLNSAISIQLSAASNGNVSYALQAGSSLPPGVALSNVGLISGTVTGITSDTTYNFTVVATDTELQDTPQAFSITITSNDQYFKNTSLLLSANTPGTTFVTDASTNAFNISVVGDTKPNSFNPYTPGYYSNYFDTTSAISLPTTQTTTGSFTAECWFYRSADPVNYHVIFGGSDIGSGGTVNTQLSVRPTGAVGFVINAANGAAESATGVVPLGQWSHIVWVRSGTSCATFVNGSRVATGTSSGTLEIKMIGSGGNGSGAIFAPSYSSLGYISNARITTTAVYDPAQTTLTVPTSPLTAITGTTVLTCQSNRLIDNSSNAYVLTALGALQIQSFTPFIPNTSYSTFGSGYFDGTGDYLTTTMPALGAGSFTVEFWFYPTDPTRAYLLLDKGFRDGNFSLNTDYLNTGAFYLNIASSTYTFSFTPPIVNRWNHIAICRDTSSLRFFLNGVQLGTTQTNSGSVTTGTLYIGGASTTGSGYVTTMGYMADLRLTTTAVYTANFTPPTAPLTAIANTGLLTLQTNQSHTNNQFVDRSTNNFLITRAGNTTAGSFSPYAGGWSNYFDGTGDYLRTTGSVLNNSAFTISFYFYPTTSSVIGLFDSGPAQTSTFRNFPANTIQDQNGGSVAFTPLVNQWNWMSIIGNGTNFTVHLNGSSVGSAAYASLVNNNFTIGTINSGGDGAYTGYISNFRVKNIASVDSIPTSPLQPVTGTTFLTCADNRFVDDSANNFAITRNGDVSVQKFSPFSMQTQIVPTSHSVYFDGNGDYLTIESSSAFNISGNFTIEGWYSFTALPGAGTNDNLWTFSGVATYNPYMYLWGDGTIILRTEQTSGTVFSVTHNFVLNTWYHIALVKSGTTFTLYINGTSAATGTSSAIVSQNKSLEIGGQSTFGFTGYLSNFRIVNGTAVYTTAFTPPTAPLTAIANTSLLTCQSTTLVDNSTNAFAITATGDARPTQVNPFGYTNPAVAAYTTTALGGSMYFDGTGDYLTAPSNAAFNLNANFTVEAWVYPTNLSGARQIFSTRASSATATSTAWSLCQNGSALGWFTTAYNISGGTINLNAWNHMAAVRSGSTLSVYLNGISIGTATLSNNFTDQQLAIGACINGTEPFIGYISDARVVKGQALYTSAFVPPAAPVDAVRNTTLLLRGTAAGVHDSTMNNNLETVGDTRINTSVVKFAGKSSIFFDGTGDYLKSVPVGAHTFGTGNFTIEMWVYPQSATGYQCMFQIGTTNPYIFLGINTGSSATPFMWNDANVIVGSQNFTLNTWQHWAIVRNSGTVTMYLNGTSIGSASYTGNLVDNTGVYLGANSGGTQPYVGYMSDVRITRGVARYTSAFTAPTSPFIQY